MRNRLLVFLPVFIAFLSCSKPAAKSNDMQPASATAAEAVSQTCPEFFYYYNQEKITMQVNPTVLLVSFAEGQTAENQRKILSRFKEFAELGSEQRSVAGTFTIVKLKPATSCPQALATAKKLQQLPEVTFANPTFKSPATLGNAYAWVGITSEFIVTLKRVEDKAMFEKTLAETKTKMLDPLGETTFLVQATKTAQGNTLEMANYFHEQPYVQSSEPDFYLANPQN
ncbi:hypothetical protein I5M27_09210 [Adhaeribacter sp. BT258]|uniref:Uncharacterized protein n=1 Tax=Adhaeribacter terrigena TaxID=2793070 RepID=A0ABS1C1T9_9BACT|nr:hypothetical protein [Adhaeribacter terrigena]MBK0403162.1 hypothetical protein [Adhaeribacter terrigena]